MKTPAPDVTIAGIELGPLIGAGASAVIRAGTVKATGQSVAVKIVHPRPGHPAGLVERALQEGRIGWIVRHPNVVRVLEWGVTRGGAIYIVMERLRGETLAERLMQLPQLPLSQVMEIGRQMASGLAAIHEVGALHRDIKPENTFLLTEPKDRVKLLDLGLVHLRNNHPARLVWTGVGLVMGTVGYLAPEQARGEKNVDIRTDIYGLGATLFDALTGHPPYQGAAAATVLAAIAEAEVPPPIPTSIPSAVRHLLSQMLHPDPNQRPDSAKAVLQVIGDMEERSGVPSERTLDQRRFPQWQQAERHEGIRARISAAVAVAARSQSGPPDLGERIERLDSLQAERRMIAARVDELRQGATQLTQEFDATHGALHREAERLTIARDSIRVAYTEAAGHLIEVAEAISHIDRRYVDGFRQVELLRRRQKSCHGALDELLKIGKQRKAYIERQTAIRRKLQAYHQTGAALSLQLLEQQRALLDAQIERQGTLAPVEHMIWGSEDDLAIADRELEHAFLNLGVALQAVGVSAPRRPVLPPPLPPESTKPIERRAHPRVPSSVQVRLNGAGFDDLCPIRDLSEGGLFVYAERVPEVGAGFMVAFAVKGDPLEIRAVVVQRIPGLGFGMRFGTMGQKKRERLRRLIRRQNTSQSLQTLQ